MGKSVGLETDGLCDNCRNCDYCFKQTTAYTAEWNTRDHNLLSPAASNRLVQNALWERLLKLQCLQANNCMSGSVRMTGSQMG